MVISTKYEGVVLKELNAISEKIFHLSIRFGKSYFLASTVRFLALVSSVCIYCIEW